MAKIIVQFNEGTTRTESQNNTVNRSMSVNFGTEKELIYKTAAGGFMRFPSSEALLLGDSSGLGFSSVSYPAPIDVKGALEDLNTRVTNLGTFSNLPEHMETTGLLSGGELSVNAGDNSTYDIAAGVGMITDYTDPENPVLTTVNFGPISAVTVSVSSIFTTVAVDIFGSAFNIEDSEPSNLEKRQYIILGRFVHDGVSPNRTNDDPLLAFNITASLNDWVTLAGIVKEGAAVSKGTGNFELNVSSARYSLPYINYKNDPIDNTVQSVAGKVDTSFFYSYQDGAGEFVLVPPTTDVDPSQWDDGSGTLQSVTGNNATIQYLVYFPFDDAFILYYGQTEYSDFDSVDFNENFTFPNVLTASNSVIVAQIAVAGNAASLAASGATIRNTGKWSEIQSSASGAGATTLQAAYNNSTVPQIIVSSDTLPLAVESATGDDTDFIFSIRNNSSVDKIKIHGDGYLLGSYAKFEDNPNASTPTLESFGTFVVSSADTLTGTPPDGLFISRSNAGPPGSRIANLQHNDDSGISPINMNGSLYVSDSSVVSLNKLSVGTLTPDVSLHVDPNDNRYNM